MRKYIVVLLVVIGGLAITATAEAQRRRRGYRARRYVVRPYVAPRYSFRPYVYRSYGFRPNGFRGFAYPYRYGAPYYRGPYRYFGPRAGVYFGGPRFSIGIRF